VLVYSCFNSTASVATPPHALAVMLLPLLLLLAAAAAAASIANYAQLLSVNLRLSFLPTHA
jgi:hypothetical protein